jgi:hypothetical protein
MTLREKQSRFAFLISVLVGYAYQRGYEITFGCAYHIPCIQCHEYEHSERSFHKQRLAFDLNLFKDGNFLMNTEDHQFLGEYWESLDVECTWGGRFGVPDGNHYSLGEGHRKSLTV